MEGGRSAVYLPRMQRGPFAGFYLVSELPVSSDGVQRWAARHADGRQGEVLLGSTELLETASKMPQGGPWGVILRGEDEAGAWVLFPGELTCSLTQLRAKISARAAFAIGHLLLEALDSVHDAGLHHGRLSPEWVGFDSEGVLRVRARPDHAETADIDASATPQDTDCWSVGGLVYFLLGGEWPPSEVVSLPDFGGMDAGRARLALSGLLRKNPRLRLKPARFARQAVAAALQDIESAEQELRSLLAAQGCGTALRDAAPVLPGGLGTDANRTLIEAFTRVVAPEANRGSSPEPRLVEDSAPENRSPIQIELALPVAEEAVSAESGAQEASVEDVPVEEEGRLEEPPTEGSEAEAIHEGSEAEATHEGSEAEEEPEPSSGQGEEEDSSPVAEEAASDEAEQPDIEEAPASSELQESNENFEEAQPSSTQAEAGDEAVEDARLGVLEEDGSEAQSPIRVQIALPQVAPESPKEPAQEVGKQPLEVEPFRMPLPEPAESMATESESASPVEESVPAGGLESDALPAPESELEPERSEAAPAVRIQLPDLAESPLWTRRCLPCQCQPQSNHWIPHRFPFLLLSFPRRLLMKRFSPRKNSTLCWPLRLMTSDWSQFRRSNPVHRQFQWKPKGSPAMNSQRSKRSRTGV